MTGPALFLACVLRGVAGEFAALDDTGHTPYGVAGVETLADRVRVHYTAPLHRIAAIQATADETYIRAGVAVGVSGGLSFADVFFAHDGAPLTPAAACLAGSNAWVTGHAWPPPPVGC